MAATATATNSSSANVNRTRRERQGSGGSSSDSSAQGEPPKGLQSHHHLKDKTGIALDGDDAEDEGESSAVDNGKREEDEEADRFAWPNLGAGDEHRQLLGKRTDWCKHRSLAPGEDIGLWPELQRDLCCVHASDLQTGGSLVSSRASNE